LSEYGLLGLALHPLLSPFLPCLRNVFELIEINDVYEIQDLHMIMPVKHLHD